MPVAIIDPNWGSPKVILETIRKNKIEAWEAASTLLSGSHGSIARLQDHGFYSATIEVGSPQHELPDGERCAINLST